MLHQFLTLKIINGSYVRTHVVLIRVSFWLKQMKWMISGQVIQKQNVKRNYLIKLQMLFCIPLTKIDAKFLSIYFGSVRILSLDLATVAYFLLIFKIFTKYIYFDKWLSKAVEGPYMYVWKKHNVYWSGDMNF